MVCPPKPLSHAYVPGVSERHLEGYFDHVRSTAREGMIPEVLAGSEAFQLGLHYLDTGYFWEAHEVFEPVWLALPSGGDERHLVQALIQFANAQLKMKMQRPKAAKRLCGIVRDLLSEISVEVAMGIEVAQISRQVDSFEQDEL